MAPLDKSSSIKDNSLYSHRRGGVQDQQRHVQGETGDRVRPRQTFRLHTTSGQHKQSAKLSTDIWGAELPLSVLVVRNGGLFCIIKLHFN